MIVECCIPRYTFIIFLITHKKDRLWSHAKKKTPTKGEGLLTIKSYSQIYSYLFTNLYPYNFSSHQSVSHIVVSSDQKPP